MISTSEKQTNHEHSEKHLLKEKMIDDYISNDLSAQECYLTYTYDLLKIYKQDILLWFNFSIIYILFHKFAHWVAWKSQSVRQSLTSTFNIHSISFSLICSNFHFLLLSPC